MFRIFFCLLVLGINAVAVEHGKISLGKRDFSPGKTFNLNGTWLYQPGYAVASNQNPQSVADKKCVPVPVPQLLNRIQWWLDDSEDFKRYETNRLNKLGFDTDRAEDGWYYLRLNLPAVPSGKNISIEFDGVAMVSKTFCNGTLLGEHKGMFSRFSYDLTPHLQAGENLLAVFVSMEKIPPSTLTMGEAVTVNLTASKVRSLSKGMFGPLSPNSDNRAYDLHGIWQPVKLVVRGAAKLDDVWFVPSLEGAEVRVEARSLASSQGAKLKAKLTDVKTGKLLAEISPEQIQITTNSVSHTLNVRDVKPKLWTPAEPNLYRLDVALESDTGEVLDSWTHNVGFRTFEARGNKFFLNGKPYWLRGANHLPYGKNPFDPALARTLIQSLHDANIRTTRTHATPWNEPWLSAADQIGLGVSLEGIRPWGLAGKIGATPPDYMAHWLMENEDVVKRARNHPSVLIYTVGNEMMLKDSKNLEKWQQLSDVVKQTRKTDPTRPVICSSEYARDPDLYKDVLKPKGIDDGDADDIHRYNNWYSPSSFITDAKFEKEAENSGASRPLIGQEMSTGYPDLDTGLPVLRYTRDLLTPQAWIGNLAYLGNDPKFFLEHDRAVTKRWAERLRFERGDRTAGFMLFAAECWFSHSYDAATAKPYPVIEAMREAFSPVGLALETGRRRFFPNEEIETAVFITNDSEQQDNFSDLRIELSFVDRNGGKKISSVEIGQLPKLAYFETARVPVKIKLPPTSTHRDFALQLRLRKGTKEISRTTDFVEVLPAVQPVQLEAPAFMRSIGSELNGFLKSSAQFKSSAELATAQVILMGPGDTFSGLEKGGAMRAAIESGATAIVFSPGSKFTPLFSADIMDGKNAPGEFADFFPCAGTKLAEKLAPMDLKWWGRKGDWRVFSSNASHRLKTGSQARELIRFIPSHSYISAEKVPEQYRTVLFEIPLGRGRLWVCDLDLEASVSVDPAAQKFAVNLLRAAADRNSTTKLPRIPSHEELLQASSKNRR
ncbi:MAG: lacZ 5 [Verrucomicrobiales bacterium]|nr:lacZ 5 [Verrucomicrobiales bacterium]